MKFSKWFKGLRVRLLTMVGIPLVTISALIYIAMVNLIAISDDLNLASNVRLPLATHSGTMTENLQAIVRFLWTAQAAVDDTEIRDGALQRAETAVTNFESAQKLYEELPRSEQSKVLYAPVSEKWKEATVIIKTISNKLKSGDEDSSEVALEMILTRLRPTLAVIEKDFNDLGDLRIKMSKVDAEKSMEDALAAKKMLVAVGVSAVVGLVILGIFIAYRLSTRLSEITYRISGAGNQVAAASQQLSDSSQVLSSGANEAAASLEETVASLEELSSMVKQNADYAKEAGALSVSARGSAEEGEKEIKELIGAMSEIAHASKKIEDIINVIDDIAFQTNLLALNAAVEAARAGEQGRGFAVVAEAVRNLAQRSASAAKDINSLIRDSVSKVERGSRIADKSGEALKSIVTSVKKVADFNGEISVASQEQAKGIAQISQAMNQLDQATQGNAASAEEAAASSEEMSSEANVLKDEVRSLLTIVEGNSADLQVKAEMRAAAAVRKPAPKSNRGGKPGMKPFSVIPGGASTAEKAIPFEDEEAPVKISEASNF